ncbi:hypothetical protein MMC10_007710 [Thelotrema lepadinum]|nr:hypothetical protein [Thelotrema lepadinum]
MAHSTSISTLHATSTSTLSTAASIATVLSAKNKTILELDAEFVGAALAPRTTSEAQPRSHRLEKRPAPAIMVVVLGLMGYSTSVLADAAHQEQQEELKNEAKDAEQAKLLQGRDIGIDASIPANSQTTAHSHGLEKRKETFIPFIGTAMFALIAILAGKLSKNKAKEDQEQETAKREAIVSRDVGLDASFQYLSRTTAHSHGLEKRKEAFYPPLPMMAPVIAGAIIAVGTTIFGGLGWLVHKGVEKEKEYAAKHDSLDSRDIEIDAAPQQPLQRTPRATAEDKPRANYLAVAIFVVLVVLGPLAIVLFLLGQRYVWRPARRLAARRSQRGPAWAQNLEVDCEKLYFAEEVSEDKKNEPVFAPEAEEEDKRTPMIW